MALPTKENPAKGDNPSLSKSVILLGDHGVGKTEFLARIIKEEGQESIQVGRRRNPYKPSSCVKTVRLWDRHVDVTIHDTGGQERYRSLTSSYYRSANGCLLFFNAHSLSSFNNLTSWIDEIYRYCPESDPPIVLVGITCPTCNNNDTTTTNDTITTNDTTTTNGTTSTNHTNSTNNTNNTDLTRNSDEGNEDPNDGTSSNTGNSKSDGLNSNTSVSFPARRVMSWRKRRSSLNYDVTSSPSTVHSRHLSQKAHLPCLDNNDITVHGTQGPHHFHGQNRRRSHGNITGRLYTNTVYENVEADYNDETLAGYGEHRVISEEEAHNFAYTLRIPYREIELGGNYLDIENVLQTIVEDIIMKGRRASRSDNDIVIINGGRRGSLVNKLMCPCS